MSNTFDAQIDSIIRQTEQKIVFQAVESLMDAAKLSVQDAKTCIYWRLGSKYLDKLSFYPLLALVGPAGSGKNTTMYALQRLPGKSSPITDCSQMTLSVAREELAKNYNATFFADEFDVLKPGVASIFMARYSRSNSIQSYKRQNPTNGRFEPVTVDIFGATVIHARNMIDEAALSSRTIQVFTRHQPGPYGDFKVNFDELDSIPFDLSNLKQTGGRAMVTYSPVIAIAQQIGDDDYLKNMDEIIQLEYQVLQENAEYDIASVILAKVVEIVLTRAQTLSNPWDRIDIEREIGSSIRSATEFVAPITINSNLTKLGFKSERRGGRRWLYPTPSSLKLATIRRNYKDEELELLFADSGI